MRENALSSKELNHLPSLKSHLIKLSFDPRKLEKSVKPFFSDSTSNYTDILGTIRQPDANESSLKEPMEQALAAQKSFKTRKAYNLNDFSFEEAQRVLNCGETQSRKKEIAVVSDLLAMRDKTGMIISFVLNVGIFEFVLDMRDIDAICGGVEGRELFLKRNRHHANKKPSAPSWKTKHGEKTSMKRVTSISAYKQTLAVKNFQHTAKEHEFVVSEKSREDVEGALFKRGKFKRRFESWEIYREMFEQAESIDENNRMF